MDRVDKTLYFTAMPKIKIDTPSKYSAEETFAKLKGFFERDEELRKMDSAYTCSFDDAALKGTAKGSKFDAAMEVSGNDGSAKVSLSVSLPLILTPIKGIVQQTLEKRLHQLLG